MPTHSDPAKSRRRSLLIVLGLFALTAAAIGVLPGMKFGSDVGNWLPDDDPRLTSLRWFHEQFPHEDRVIVTFDGCRLDDPRLAKLVEELKARSNDEPPTGISEVHSPADLLADLTRKRIPEDVAIDRLRGVVLGAGENPPALIAVSVHDEDVVSDKTLFRTLRESAEAAGIAESELHLGGRRVASAHLDHEILLSAWNTDVPLWLLPKRSPFLFTLVMSVVLAFLILRSARLTVLILAAALVSVILSVGILSVTGGTMNMILTVMPTLLLVLNLSGGIHLGNYWKHAAVQSPQDAAVVAQKSALLPMSLACLTTAIGLAALCSSPLQPIREFGLYSAIGCGVSLIVLLWGLPSLLVLFPPRIELKPESGRNWQAYSGWISRHSRKLLAAGLGLFAVSVTGFLWFESETKVIRFFPDGHRVLRDYRYIESRLAGIVPVDVVIRFPAEARERYLFSDRMDIVRHVQDAINDHLDVSGSLCLADFADVPRKDLTTMQRVFSQISLRKLEERVHAGTEKNASNYLRIASADLDGDEQQQIAKGDEIWRIRAQVAVTTQLNYAVLNDQLTETTRSALNDYESVGSLVTGMVPLFLRTQQALLEGLIKSFGLAFAVIVCVMSILLRDLKGGLLMMVPNAFPILMVFGLLSWAGHPVDIGMMITASIVLGIAVDDTLHLMTWYREARAHGASPADSIAAALKHCGTAMTQTTLIISVGLLMLCPAELLLIRRFGWLMALLVSAALIADLVLLPALLVGPLRRLGEVKEQNLPKESTPTPAEQIYPQATGPRA